MFPRRGSLVHSDRYNDGDEGDQGQGDASSSPSRRTTEGAEGGHPVEEAGRPRIIPGAWLNGLDGCGCSVALANVDQQPCNCTRVFPRDARSKPYRGVRTLMDIHPAEQP
jgi:hypothetical protein